MKQRRNIFGKGFFYISILGALFLFVELVFQYFGSSICHTEGCRVVGRHARFGDISIILIGLSTFAILSLLSFLAVFRSKAGVERYINLVLVVSLAGEGFFAGYQAFRIYTPCLICLATLGFFLTLGILRSLYGEKEVIAGFLSFAGVFALFYLVLPAESMINVPQDNLVLFYSEGCKYCSAVSRELEEHNIRVNHVRVDKYTDFLKKMEIDHVPTLYVNEQTKKIFLTGRQAIDQYLFGSNQHLSTEKKFEPSKGKSRPVRRGTVAQNKTKHAVKAPSNSPQPSAQAPTRTLSTPNQPASTPTPLPDEGMCKEDEQCE